MLVTISNPMSEERTGELIEVPMDHVFRQLKLKDTSGIVIYDAKSKEIPYQLTADGMLVFPVSVAAGGVSAYTIQEGTPAVVNTPVFGRHYPERLDDIAWENDRMAFRAYGPALQQRGEKAFGYDILTKSVPEPVVEERYARELDKASRARIDALRREGEKAAADSLWAAISYHVDHGNGMDVYTVGPTLGGGTAALMPDSAIVYPYCYQNFELLDNGPLRFTVKLTFGPLVVRTDSNVIETRIIQLDKGSQLNKTTVTYHGLSAPVPVVAGIVLHKQHKDGYAFDAQKGYIAYADSTDNPRKGNGVIYVGAVFPDALAGTGVQWFPRPVGDALGHVLGVENYLPGSGFTYYWGAGWSKYGFSSEQAWIDYLKAYAERVRNPLKVTVR